MRSEWEESIWEPRSTTAGASSRTATGAANSSIPNQSVDSETIDLGMINPDLPPARALLDRLIEGVGKPGQHRYSVARGIRKLRIAFADRYKRVFGVAVNPDLEVCITGGTKDALNSILQLLALKRDGLPVRVLVGTPEYPGYRAALSLVKCEVLHFNIADNSQQTLESLLSQLQGAEFDLVILNFPNNPTGLSVDLAFYDQLAQAVEGTAAVVWNDFVYGDVAWSGSALPSASVEPARLSPATSILRSRLRVGRVLESYSMSKAFCIPGWRVAALLGSAEIIDQIAALKANSDFGLFLPFQYAAAFALGDDHLPLSFAKTTLSRAAFFATELEKLGWKVSNPSGGATVWARLPSSLLGNDAAELLATQKIVAVSGVRFGVGKDWVRFAMVAGEEQLRTALARISALSSQKECGAALLQVVFVILAFLFLPLAVLHAEGGEASEATSTPPERGSGSGCSRASVLVAQGVKLADGSDVEESSYKKAIELCPDMAEAHHNLAVVQSKRGSSEAAIQSFKKAIAARDDAQFRVALGALYLDKSQVDLAKEQYQAVVEKEPTNAKALQGLAVCLERVGKIDEAIATLEKAAASDSSSSVTYFNLGLLYEKNKQNDLAIKNYQRVTELDPNNSEAALYLGLLLSKSDREDEALRALERAITLDPESAQAHQAIGLLAKRRGDLDRAENSFRRAISLHPNDIVSMVNVGLVLIAKKQEALAVDFLLRATKIDPKNPLANNALGWAYLELGDFAAAEAAINEALRFDATSAIAHNNLGVLYQRTGRLEEAKRAFQQAVRLNPELESAKNNLSKFGYKE